MSLSITRRRFPLGCATRRRFSKAMSIVTSSSPRFQFTVKQRPGPDENAPTEKYEGADPYKETLEAMKASGYKTYGPLKALSEKEAEKWFPGKTLIIRPGLIVGPRDETDRFTYWPVRIDRGGEVLAPGSPDDPGTIHRCPRSR